MNKLCPLCGETKTVSKFLRRSPNDLKHRHGNGRYSSRCKECNRKYIKTYYVKNRLCCLQKHHRFKKLNRNKVFAFLQDKQCIDCGENDPLVLDFDHISRHKKTKDISIMLVQNSWANILKEIEKCEIRCANCHRKKTAKQLGYTKYLLQQNESKSGQSTS